MNWNQAIDDDRRALRRICAFLFLFAWMARFSCALPASARFYMLGVLHRAETRARDFVVAIAVDHGRPLPACLLGPVLHDGNSPADAVRLAHNFRALAVLLGLLLDSYPGGRNCRINRVSCGSRRAGWLLAASSRLLAATMLRQHRLSPAHVLVERLDSS